MQQCADRERNIGNLKQSFAYRIQMIQKISKNCKSQCLIGLWLILIASNTAAATDTWYQALHPAARATFERYAGDYLSVNGYLWSQRTLRLFNDRVDAEDPNDPLHQAVTDQTPFYYDPVTGTAVSTINELIDATPGVDRLTCVVVTIDEEGTLVRQEDRRLALLVDNNKDRVDGDRLNIPVMRAGRHQLVDEQGKTHTIARYESLPVHEPVRPSVLALWFNDHDIDRFVYFELKKVVERKAKKRYVTKRWKEGMWRHSKRVYIGTDPEVSHFQWHRREVRVPHFKPEQ